MVAEGEEEDYCNNYDRVMKDREKLLQNVTGNNLRQTMSEEKYYRKRTENLVPCHYPARHRGIIEVFNQFVVSGTRVNKLESARQ